MLTTITQAITDFCRTRPIEKAWIFGSFSRGEERADSDVDLIVAFCKDAKVSLLDHAQMICDLEDRLARRVDIVREGTLLPFAATSANRDKILIYERNATRP